MSIIMDVDSKNVIIDILNKNIPENTKVYAFGSRVKGTTKQYADLDLALSASGIIEQIIIDKLNIAFENSCIPFKIDIVDLNNIDKEFYQAIEKDLTLFNS